MKRVNGITLIALIITIIVLLILTGVALATLTGEGSLINNAENAVAQYNNKVIEEQFALNNIEKYLENRSIASSTDTQNGKCTLLWESFSSAEEYEYKEEIIEVENLSKYKYIFMELFFYTSDDGFMPLRGFRRRCNLYTKASNNRR